MKLQELKPFGVYVAVKPTVATAQLLNAWAVEAGIQLDEDLHVTLLYSRKMIQVFPNVDEYQATPVSLMSLGDAAVVLKLESTSLVRRHNQLVQQGGTHDFPDYTPHITLKAKDCSLEGLPPISFGLLFCDEYSEPLSE